MLIEEALYSLLKDDPGIKAIVIDRIYPVTMPQLEKGKSFYPALTYDLTARERQQSHDGPTGLVKSSYTISSLSPKYIEAKALAQSVRLALNGKSSALAAIYGMQVRGVFLENETDEYLFDEIEELALYHVPQEFVIQHKEEI